MYIAIEHSKAIPFCLHACKVLTLGETLNNLCVLKRHTDHLLYGEIILKAVLLNHRITPCLLKRESTINLHTLLHSGSFFADFTTQ